MSKNLDTRVQTFPRPWDYKEVERAVNENLPDKQIIEIHGVNSFLSSAQQVRSIYADRDYGAPGEAATPEQDPIARAQNHIRLIAPALGFGPSQTPEFVPDPHVKTTLTGERIVNLQQTYRGIPVFQMELAVWMDSDGTIYNVAGASVGLPNDLEILPQVKVEQALLAALTYLSAPERGRRASRARPSFTIDPNGDKPRVLARTMLPSQPTAVEHGQLGEAVPAHLVLLYQGETTRLCWSMILTARGIADQYSVVVEADSRTPDKLNPQVLYCQRTSKSMADLSATVWENNPLINQGTGRRLMSFPRPKEDYPSDSSINHSLPDDFPSTWINGDPGKAEGNCAIVVFKSDMPVLPPLPLGLKLKPTPSDELGEDQRVLNAFYFCNFMHDFFYTLGFDERASNFQRVNANGVGAAGDPVIARITDQSTDGVASMLTGADGSQAIIEIGRHPDAGNHGALDADTTFHEYAHGVTNRLVGAKTLDPDPLQQPQSRGMSEGWSDYFALTIQSFYLPEDRLVIGEWITGKSTGLRGVAYDAAFARSAVGRFRAIGSKDRDEGHEIGKIWCAALMQMNRKLGSAFDDNRKKGHLLGWLIVVAGLLHTPANPNFLQGRDAIVHALECRKRKGLLNDEDFLKAYKAVWEAFTLSGMGGNAKSDGNGLFGIQEDTDMNNIPPPRL